MDESISVVGEIKVSKVAILKTTPKTIIEDYARLMHLAEYREVLPNDVKTIIKLNLSWSLFFPSCSTAPWQLEGITKTLQADGYANIEAMENKTVVTKPLKGAKQNKWMSVFGKYNIPFTPLTEVEWVEYKPTQELLVLDTKVFNKVEIPKCFIGANVIHPPTQKTHGHTTITGAMKNAFGGLLKDVRHHCHKYIHEVLVDLLVIQKEIHKGIFAVMDGTVCGDGAGPRTMIPKIKNYILASEDQVALDAISAKMMGFDPMTIRKISLAHDLGLGCGDVKQIEILGEDISRVNYGFKTSKSPVVFFDQFFRSSWIEPLLFHTWFFKFCILGSALYHDYYWYPIKGRKYVKEFMRSEWGELFEEY